MCSKLHNHQSNIDCYICRKQLKPIIYTQKIKRKESNITLKKINHKQREQERKKGTENYKDNQRTINKMAISTYLSNTNFKCKWTKYSNQKTQDG